MRALVKHKKINLPTALMCALCVCVVFALIFSIKNDAPKRDERFFTCYDLNITYDGQNQVFVNQEVLFRAASGMNCDHVVFNVYANAYSSTNNAIDILCAKIDGKTVDYEIYGKNNTLLKLPCNIRENDVFTFCFEYKITLENQNARLGKTQNGLVNLTCFYPILAVWQNGWREDDFCYIGDPFICETSSYFASISCDKNLQIASSGIAYDIVQNDEMQTVFIEANCIRDFAIVIGDMQKTSTTLRLENKDVDVVYFYTDDNHPNLSLDRMTSSIQAFSQAFGEYPYSSLTIAQSALDDVGGMEYGTFAIVSPSTSQEEYLNSITHEIAHQWWYNAVGNDQINNAWLDEGLCEFCTFYYYFLCNERKLFSNNMKTVSALYTAFASELQCVGFDGQMNKPLSQYLTNGEYVAVVYLKGAMLFDLLHNLVGDKKFCKALSCYFESNKYAIATPDDLICAFRQQGYDIRPIIENYTSNNVFCS